jgi:hypothetical protein
MHEENNAVQVVFDLLRHLIRPRVPGGKQSMRHCTATPALHF